MVDLGFLARRAKASGDGEAYAVVSKARGYRLGIGARAASDGKATFFVEVVLDPIPDRPRVDPDFLHRQATLLAELKRRGYALTCDDTRCVTCERETGRAAALKEARALDAWLVEALRKPGIRPRA